MAADLSAIYSTLHGLISSYTPPLTAKIEEDSRYEVYSLKPVELAGRPIPELFFAGLGRRSNYVGLYFFPIYTHPEEFTGISAILKKCLKGKSCFHIKTLEGAMLKDIEKMLRDGYDFYKEKKLI
ncbi:MAG TPA: hypothetical protein VM802_11740 [Chitinophaga sp.]|uniref:hypothetical protein n=1 Tax=Chitinophaga sp. TaxID=1869181 RepID=UPI002B7ACC47|nr:hypothetical protein [Chitinophaga sp.]HVI45539.1 hypothetical protein [Chitinophaga sp.]